VHEWQEGGREVFQAFCTQAAIAIENGRLRDAQARKTAEQEVLLSLSRHLRVAQMPEEMYRIVCEQALGSSGAQFAGINLLDPDRQTMTRVYAIGPDGAPASGQKIPVPGSMSETAMKTAAALRGTDFWRTRPGNWAPAYYQQLGPFIIVPLRSDEEIIGTLLLARDRTGGHPFEDDEVRLLESIGEMGGESIRRARLFAEAGQRLEQLEALRAIDMAITGSFDLKLTLNIVLERAMARLSVDAADVLVFDSRTQTLTLAVARGFRSSMPRVTELRLGEGIAGRAALDRKTVAVADLRSAADTATRAPQFAEEQFVACYAVPLIAKGQIRGVLEIFHREPLAPEPEWLEFLEALGGQAAIAVENGTMLEDLQRTYVELALAYDATIEGWSRALDLRDNETEGHTKRVTDLTLHLARQLNVSPAEFTHLRRGALLHDIGKMGIPDKILLKPGPLTDDEWVIMRRHPVYAY
jgi:HD-GYP domain-containing protein (c-di-GMP phosphodiesterase class II)